jgi:hypothetical protein
LYAGSGPDEQGELARFVHEHFGVEVCHADPAELALEGDEVTYQGRVIDLIYRDYAVEDLLELEAEGVDIRPMQQAFASNRVVSSIAAELDQKSCWEVLGDPVLGRRHFSGEERGFFRRHLPWTRVLRPATTTLPDGSRGNLVDYVLGARKDLVLKPNRSYGGTGVTIGPVTADAEWKQLVDTALAPGGERWVAQRLVQLPVCQFPTLGADGRIHDQPFYVVYGFAWATRPGRSCKPARPSTSAFRRRRGRGPPSPGRTDLTRRGRRPITFGAELAGPAGAARRQRAGCARATVRRP